jgi:hypothetical protein
LDVLASLRMGYKYVFCYWNVWQRFVFDKHFEGEQKAKSLV